MSNELKEFLKNKAEKPILVTCVMVPLKDYENDKRSYIASVERTLLQQVLDGKNLGDLSVDGNKSLINNIKKEFHIETFTENQNVYVKAWIPESFEIDISKYEKRVTKMVGCQNCGNEVNRNWKFCPSCGREMEVRK